MKTRFWAAFKGQEIMAGGAFYPTREIAEIEVNRMVRRQPAHLSPRPFISEHDV